MDPPLPVEAARERLLDLQTRIRRKVRAALERGAGARGEDAVADEAGVAEEGVADITFRLDVAAEEEIEAFAEDFARLVPLRVLSEGLGDRVFAARGQEPVWRLVIDPIDGTRNLMFDLRSGFALTALATERGGDTRLADVFLAVQGELPQRDRVSATILSAIRGRGARLERIALADDRVLEDRALVASSDARLDNGFHVFFKFNRQERGLLGRIEQRYLELVAEQPGVDARLLFDDQYISSAGQLYLLLTRRYRFLADLRGVVGDHLGIMNQTSKPYDVCCALIAQEAGIPLRNAFGREFDLPLDLEARVDLVAYANEAVRQRLEPLLVRAIREVVGTWQSRREES